MKIKNKIAILLIALMASQTASAWSVDSFVYQTGQPYHSAASEYSLTHPDYNMPRIIYDCADAANFVVHFIFTQTIYIRTDSSQGDFQAVLQFDNDTSETWTLVRDRHRLSAFVVDGDRFLRLLKQKSTLKLELNELDRKFLTPKPSITYEFDLTGSTAAIEEVNALCGR